MTFRSSVGKFTKGLRKRLDLYSWSDIKSAIRDLAELEKGRRSFVKQAYIDLVDRIVDQPAPYSLLKKYSNVHPFLRIVHGARIREVVKNRWDVQERFAKKCTSCGKEFKQIVEECDDCKLHGTPSVLRDPNPQEKKLLETFLKDPNRDDEFIDILKSVLKDNLAVDDWYLSVRQIEGTNQWEMYAEDASELFICADKHARLGNGVFFCKKCWSQENQHTYTAEERCGLCGGELTETAYVQKHEGTIKARFGKKEIIHSNSDPWLPSLYGNSKVLAVMLELRTAYVMQSFNFGAYSKGTIDKLIVMKGEPQEKADEIAASAKEQREKVVIDSYTGRVGRESSGSLFLGSKEGVDIHDMMPELEKMQSLEWMDFWFVKIVGAIYGVQPVMINANVRGPGGYFQRMQIVVQNDATHESQRGFEDPFNEQFVLGCLGIRDWEFKFNEIEDRDELGDAQIWQAKVAAGTTAVEAGLQAEITDEGELKISGKFVKPEMPSRATSYIMPKPPQVPQAKMPTPMSQEKMKKAFAGEAGDKSYFVTETSVLQNLGQLIQETAKSVGDAKAELTKETQKKLDTAVKKIRKSVDSAVESLDVDSVNAAIRRLETQIGMLTQADEQLRLKELKILNYLTEKLNLG